RLEYRALLLRAEDDGGVASGELPADPLRRRAIHAARQSILKLRESEEIGDDAFHLLEEEFDWAELSAQGRIRRPGERRDPYPAAFVLLARLHRDAAIDHQLDSRDI